MRKIRGPFWLSRITSIMNINRIFFLSGFGFGRVDIAETWCVALFFFFFFLRIRCSFNRLYCISRWNGLCANWNSPDIGHCLCVWKHSFVRKYHTIYSLLFIQRASTAGCGIDSSVVHALCVCLVGWISIFSSILFMYSSTLYVVDVTSFIQSECMRTPHSLSTKRKQPKITFSIC